MTRESGNRAMRTFCFGLVLFAGYGMAQQPPKDAAPCNCPSAGGASTPPAAVPSEAESLLAAQWTTEAGAKACIDALNIATDPANNPGKNPLDALKSVQSDKRAQEVYDIAARDSGFWETVATAGGDKMPDGITTMAQLFESAKDKIAKIYGNPDATKLAALDAANSAFQAKNYLRALYLLLAAVDQTSKCACDWINEMQLYRACYKNNRGKLLGYVAEHFKAKK